MDYEKLISTFIDEARERTADLEEGLLKIEKSPYDQELITSVFRAAHTIKGTSGNIGEKRLLQLNSTSAFLRILRRTYVER